MKSILWQLMFLGMLQFDVTHSQQSTSDTADSAGANVKTTSTLQSEIEIVNTTFPDSFYLSPSFMELTPVPTMSQSVSVMTSETPNQEDVLTLTLINASATPQLEGPEMQTKMLRDTFSVGSLDEDSTVFTNQSINNFVILDTNSSEDDTENTISPTAVTNEKWSASLTDKAFTSVVHSPKGEISSTPTHSFSSIYDDGNFSAPTDFSEATERDIQNDTKIGFVMTFQSDCITDVVNETSLRSFVEELLRNNSVVPNNNVTNPITSNICERIISEVPLLFDDSRQNVDDILKSLKKLVGNTNITVKSFGKDYVLTLVKVVPFPSNAPRDVENGQGKDADEFLPYAIIGGVFGGILLIVLILMCGKCLCRCKKKKKHKKPDFEVPHVSLRPEDYMLTRIPRPTTIYSDNMASPIMHDDASVTSEQACYNGDQPPRQPFETSVVPMNDILREDDPYYRYKQHEYLPNDSSTELRTFNGKRLHHRSTETDDGVLYRNPYLSASTEKIHDLHHRRSRDISGVDNQAYMRA